jgi:hypothetical protein
LLGLHKLHDGREEEGGMGRKMMRCENKEGVKECGRGRWNASMGCKNNDVRM